MSQEERFGTRDRTYSAWHRRLSTRRFVGIERAQLLAMIDLDSQLWVEYQDKDYVPLALVETALDVGQTRKTATVTRNLARISGLPAYTVLYKPSDAPNPADEACLDIESFRVKRLWPEPETEFRTITPRQWAEALVKIRQWSARKLDVVAVAG